MPRTKPAGWPKLMVARRLKTGATAYYWGPPTWATKGGCPLTFESLGADYGEATRRCDDILNPQVDAWRSRSTVPVVAAAAKVGTFDWLAGVYRSSPKFTDRPPRTRKSYDAALALVAEYKVKDGRRFGSLALASIQPGVADRLYDRLKTRADGTPRVRTAILAMTVCKRAWNVARRDRPQSRSTTRSPRWASPTRRRRRGR